MQSTCIQMNVSLLRKGYNIRLILLGQIDMLGGNIYPPMHIPGRVAFVYYSFCVSVGAVVLDVAWLFHQLEKENPTYIVKKFNMRAFRENRYQLYTESFKRIPQKLYASAVC